MREDLLRMKNIGAKSVDKLLDVGYETPAQISADGAAMVYWRLRQAHPVSLTMLWALQGALLDMRWAQLPGDMKESLLAELSAIEGEGQDLN